MRTIVASAAHLLPLLLASASAAPAMAEGGGSGSDNGWIASGAPPDGSATHTIRLQVQT